MTAELAQAFFHFVGAKFLAYVAEPAVRSLMVGCVAAIALEALRVKRVATRLYVWTAVLVVALAMPLLGTIVPRLPLGVPASSVEKIAQKVPLVKEASDQWSVLSGRRKAVASDEGQVTSGQKRTGSGERQARFAMDAAPLKKHFSGAAVTASLVERPRLGSDEMRIATGTKLRKNVAPAAPEEMPVMPFSSIPVTADEPVMAAAQIASAIALGVYFLVALVLLARLLIGVWFSARLARAANDIEDREGLRLLRFRACIAGIEAPRLRECAALRVPATVGVWRAAILLPQGWRGWTAEQLDAILAHEVSHVARRDALTQMLSLVHRAIFWFSPLAWWLDRQLSELAEEASDEAALAGGADRTRYAETLLGFFAQLESARGRVWWQGVSMAKKSRTGSAERRVDRILAWKGTMSMKKSLAIAVIAMAAPVIFLAAAVHPVITHAQDKAQDKPQSDKGNVITPGGPKAPALPNAPQAPGVVAPASLAMPPAPASAPQGGVVVPGTPPAPKAPAPGTRVENPGPMPPAPPGGVVAPPPLPGAPTGPITARPDAPAPAPMAPTVPANVSVVSISAMASLAPSAPQSTHINVSDSADGRAGEAQLRAAEKALRDAEQQVEASNVQVRDAREALRKAQAESTRADSQQVQTAEANLEKAVKARADSEQAHEDAVAQARAAEEAYRDARRAQVQAVKQARVAAEAQREAAEQARNDMENARKAQEQAMRAQEDAQNTVRAHGDAYSYGYGSRYVIMSGANEGVEMSGDDEDFHHAQELRKKLGKDLIWFERDEKSYVITDPAFIAKAKALFAPEEALAKQQDELGSEQDALGKQQDALGEQMDKVSVKPPDISADLQRIQARLKELEASGATQRELGDVQRELGELQRRVGEVQRDAGVQQSAIGLQQSELGRKQSELGRKQSELGRQQAGIARQASQQLRSMFDDAIAKGITKPE